MFCSQLGKLIGLRGFSSQASLDFKHLKVSFPKPYVASVELNRPEKRNALEESLWRDIPDCFSKLSQSPNVRVIVLSGNGSMFCGGIDLAYLASATQVAFSTELDTARRAFKLKEKLDFFQRTFTAIEQCSKPVIAAVHSGCIGAALNLMTACDIRYASEDSFFELKEIDVGFVANDGVIQRIVKQVGNNSWLKEIVLTARRFDCKEALQHGFISKIASSKEKVLEEAFRTAELIAAKSPVAVQGAKVHLNISRDHSVAEALQYMLMWNISMVQSEDLLKAALAAREKSSAIFEDV